MSRFATVNPVFRYANCLDAIDWLERAYGFRKHELHQAPDGTVAHAELRFHDAAIGLSSVGPAQPDNPWSMVRCGVYVSLQDVDAIYARAQAAHADIAQTIRDMDYGSRDFSVRDPGGHLWGFGTYGMAASDAEPRLFVTLHYPDGTQAIEWLQRAIGFEKTLEIPGEAGAVEHAELRFGSGLLMISSAPPSHGLWGDQRQCSSVYVADPDAHFERAAQAGATIVQPPTDTPYGARAYYTSDLEGFLWGFSTYRPSQTR